MKMRTRRQLVSALLEAPDRGGALELARSHRALVDPDTATMISRRFSRLWPRDLGRANRAASAGRVVAEVDRGRWCRALAHRMSGVMDHLEGRPGAASRALERAAHLFEADGRMLESGDVHRILVDVLSLAGDGEGARAAAARARRAYRRAGGADARRLGSLAMHVGHLHYRRNAYREALRSYAEARRHFERAGVPARLANVDYNRGLVLEELDRTTEARELYRRAREILRAEGFRTLVAQADYAIAGVSLLEGDLDLALNQLRKVREQQRSLGDTQGMAHSDLEAAEALLRLNRPVEAARAARRAERFFRRAGHPSELARCAERLGAAALQQNEYSRARRLFGEGRDLQIAGHNPVGAAILETGLALAELGAGRATRALEIADRAARRLRRERLASREGRALAVGAQAALGAGRLRQARGRGEKALAISRRRRDLRVELAALLVLGRIERASGRRDREYRRLRAAERCVEKLRRGVTAEESRLAFALDKSEVYESLVTNRLERGDPRSVRQALVFAERGKARALAEKLAGGRIDELAGGTRSAARLLKRLSRVERELALAESRLEDPTAAPGMRSARLSRLERLTRSRVRALERLSSRDPERATLVGAAPPDPWAAIERLGPRDIVLEYTQGDGHLHLFVIERGSVEAYPRIASIDEVRAQVDLLRFQLGKGVLGEDHMLRFSRFIEATVRAYLERLHRLLLGPVANRLEGRSVRIVPHGILHGIPFHAFERDGSALIERCFVSYSSSLAVMELIDRRPATPVAHPLVLGVPDRSAPMIEAEVASVQRHLRGARVFRGEQATSDILRSAGRRPSLLHVACHGFFAEGSGVAGGLRLGDAWLSLPELYALEGTADLVVLSGCETGRGTVYSGDEWVGLVRGFLLAGARSVVAALWEVHDRSAVRLMDDFYRRLAGGRPVAEALAMAQRQARRDHSLPLLWAPFMVSGDPSLRMPERKAA